MQDRPTKYAEMIPLHDMTYNNRLGMMMGTNSLKRQQTSLDTETTTVTDHAVAKISTMFPTVTETHIRTLLLKYHNREAVVMSALQVEKHPLVMPGPYTPPPGVRPLPGLGLYAVTPSLTPRPNSSPKMKLRYLKNVFPIVEETMLLDTLTSSDNNVHRATQTLVTMGFDKKVMSSPRVCLQKQDTVHNNTEQYSSKPVVQSPSHRMKSIDEKLEMKMRLKRKHSYIPDRVVSMALDSVDFDEVRADQILNMMGDEQLGHSKPSATSSNDIQEGENEIIIEELPLVESAKSPPIINFNKDKLMNQNTENSEHSYQVSFTKNAIGPNPNLSKGPNQALLLLSHRPDYIAWVGSNVELAIGPNPSLRRSSTLARGSNPALYKGPNHSLAKGSMYNCRTSFYS